MLKAVVDTSVFVAGYLSRTGSGYSAQIITRWRAQEFQLIMSRQLLEEIVGKFVEKGIDEALILEFVQVVLRIALNIPGSYVVYRLDDVDPNDNMVLAAAEEGGADYLVSLDAKHLLPLKHHKGTQIVEPELFLRALD
ncbi:MAG: putative toxin-antitoxin system toxin component, PIN family, partial [Candidatus Obscuribacterales bacterium]|nr:putative toxin-antitoxin system toxin component, PIN family [Candidatus Obscuribacterales bacterium]